MTLWHKFWEPDLLIKGQGDEKNKNQRIESGINGGTPRLLIVQDRHFTIFVDACPFVFFKNYKMRRQKPSLDSVCVEKINGTVKKNLTFLTVPVINVLTVPVGI